jgi:hypothetical protein
LLPDRLIFRCRIGINRALSAGRGAAAFTTLSWRRRRVRGRFAIRQILRNRVTIGLP